MPIDPIFKAALVEFEINQDDIDKLESEEVLTKSLFIHCAVNDTEFSEKVIPKFGNINMGRKANLRRAYAMMKAQNPGLVTSGSNNLNSSGSSEKAESGPPSDRFKIKCFSIIDAPNATLATATPIPLV